VAKRLGIWSGNCSHTCRALGQQVHAGRAVALLGVAKGRDDAQACGQGVLAGAAVEPVERGRGRLDGRATVKEHAILRHRRPGEQLAVAGLLGKLLTVDGKAWAVSVASKSSARSDSRCDR